MAARKKVKMMRKTLCSLVAVIGACAFADPSLEAKRVTDAEKAAALASKPADDPSVVRNRLGERLMATWVRADGDLVVSFGRRGSVMIVR